MTTIDITALRARLDQAETAARADEPGYPWVEILGDAYLMPRAVTLALIARDRETLATYQATEDHALHTDAWTVMRSQAELVWRFWMEP